ncbi:MAG TPA: lysophospholipid acyltransferase family protein [Candidatus Binatia bacterium]|nr:lysophospholipid acyltransferase family protein [Candidatus Binatia bacterium]
MLRRLDRARLRAALRFDGAAWRRFAELGCVYGPEWWKRGSPPVIAAIIFAIARAQRTAVLANQRQVRGPRGPLRERWDAYRVFAEFARSVTEGFEQWGPRPRPLELQVIDSRIVDEALAEHRGLVMLTGHFGSWEVAARVLAGLGRPVNMVTAHEPNPTVREFMHAVRTRHGFNVIYSDRSVFTGLPILQALRRDEIVGMQIEPWGPLPGSHEVEFCGRTTSFQLGPFAVARVARAPIVPVFAVRTGIRRYEIRVVGRFDPRTPADSVAALVATVRAYEEIVRQHPAQWLMFEPVWGAAPPARERDLPMPRAAGVRPR